MNAKKQANEVEQANEVNYVKAQKINWIILSEAAREYLLHYLEKKEQVLGVRLSIKKTGCSGYGYELNDVQSLSPADYMQNLDEHYQLFIDPTSLPLLKGLHIDYIKEGFQSKLIFHNPNETGKCGCGESFTID